MGHIPRNYVIMEVKSNLIKAERAELLARFSAAHFKTVATVVMGKPSEEYKEKKLEKRLQVKQEKANAEWKAKKAEERQKKIDAGEDVPDEEEEPEEPEEPSEEEPEEEVKKEEEVKEEVKEEEAKDEEMKEEDNEPPPTVELTEEEKAEVFKKGGASEVSDLTEAALNQYYGKFTVP